MLPRSRQKPHDEEQLTSRVWTSPGTEREGAGESGTARYAEFSKVSAKMVDLSLQEAQRALTPLGAVKNELAPVLSPLRGLVADRFEHWTATDRKRAKTAKACTGDGGCSRPTSE